MREPLDSIDRDAWRRWAGWLHDCDELCAWLWALAVAEGLRHAPRLVLVGRAVRQLRDGDGRLLHAQVGPELPFRAPTTARRCGCCHRADDLAEVLFARLRWLAWPELACSARPDRSAVQATAADFPALSTFYPAAARAYFGRAAEERLEVLVFKGRPYLLRRPGPGRVQARPLA
jgi:hypothetical protein